MTGRKERLLVEVEELLRQLNGDPAYHQYTLLCKIYISLCQARARQGIRVSGRGHIGGSGGGYW